jgi:hypothetical protein
MGDVSNAKKGRPSFGVKMFFAVSGLIVLIYLMARGYMKSFPMFTRTENSIVYPPRVTLMMINTLSIFFFMMSIMEFNLHYAINPLGIRLDKISSDTCKNQLQAGFWVLMVIIVFLLTYNTSMIYKILGKPKLTDAEEQQNPGKVETIKRYLNAAKRSITHNDTNFVRIVRTVTPSNYEIIMCVFFAISSLTVYLSFICTSYFTDDTPLKDCVGNTSGVDNIYTAPPPPNCLYPNESDAVKTCSGCPEGKTPVCKSSDKDSTGCWHCNACECLVLSSPSPTN